MSDTNSPWLTPDQVREYLGGISARTLARYRERGLNAIYLSGVSPRYHRDDVDRWVRSQGRP